MPEKFFTWRLHTMNENTNITCENESVKSCDECGQCDVELFEVDGRLLCEECLERLGYVRCQHCGKWFDPDDEGGIYDDEYICDDCISDLNLERCDECGEYHKSYRMVTANGRWRNPDLSLCEDCLERMLEREDVFHCDDCGDYFLSRAYDRYTTASGDTICEDCRNDHYSYCSVCDELYHEDDMHWDDDEDAWFCNDCWDESRNRYGRKINQYSYKPDPVFIGKFEHMRYGRPGFGDPLTFGFELEVDKGHDRNNCAGEIDEAFGSDVLYMKEDGSVDFEIVTHPHTLRAYLDDFDFEKLCRIPRSYDYKSHDAGTCGFHIHVGRSQLASNTSDERRVISHIILLMHRHWPYLVKFSRRNEGQLNRWAKAPNLNFYASSGFTAEELYTFLREGYMSNYDRYLALNLQNRGTIEFRLWRGSLKPETLKATIQLTSNIVRYAMDHTMYDVAKSEFDDIVQYETCPELLSYMEGLDLSACVPNPIPLSTEAKATNTGALGCTYKIGDRVRIMRPSTLVSKEMVGAFGTVRAVKPVEFPSRRYDIAVQIEMPDDPMLAYTYRNNTHWCEGHCPDDDGYWVNPENIAHVRKANEDFEVGDVLDMSGTDVLGWLACGDERDEVSLFPEVLRIKDDGMVGLYFPFYRHGHDCDLGENFPADYHPMSGWWFTKKMLKAIADHEIASPFSEAG
jgi:hypothetical protein